MMGVERTFACHGLGPSALPDSPPEGLAGAVRTVAYTVDAADISC